jgi:hypothetical protein
MSNCSLVEVLGEGKHGVLHHFSVVLVAVKGELPCCRYSACLLIDLSCRVVDLTVTDRNLASDLQFFGKEIGLLFWDITERRLLWYVDHGTYPTVTPRVTTSW